ncbi:MAG: DUF3788 domain-containing protein [Candidatus Thorarchaeota archaeon]
MNVVVKGNTADSSQAPTDKAMIKFIGKQGGRMWKAITQYLSNNYDFEPVREKEELESTIRYRKSGKTLITFYPKKDELTVLIIFGKKEVEKFENSKDDFSPEIVELFENTKQYHDGKWLHIKIPPFKDFEDIKKLLHIKRRPKKDT